MKINKEVSDLARKLEFIGIEEESRRKIIKRCFNPLKSITGIYLIKQINKSYKNIKKEIDNYNKLVGLEEKTQRIFYN